MCGGLAPVSVCDRGLSPLREPTPVSWGDSERDDIISPLSSSRSCSEKERSLFRGVGELSTRLISTPSGDSSSFIKNIEALIKLKIQFKQTKSGRSPRVFQQTGFWNSRVNYAGWSKLIFLKVLKSTFSPWPLLPQRKEQDHKRNADCTEISYLKYIHLLHFCKCWSF